MKKIVTVFLVLSPLLSSMVGLIIYQFDFNKAFFIEKLLRDPVLYGAFLVTLFLSFVKMRISKKMIIEIGCIALLIVALIISFAKHSAYSTSVKVFRDFLALIIPVIIGFRLIDEKTFKKTIMFLALSSFVVLSIEFVVTPMEFWSSIGYTDYYLQKQKKSLDVNGFSNFNGFRDEGTVTGLYMNYDSFGDQKKMNIRYGGILGEPIEFGHVFAFIALFLISHQKKKYLTVGKFCGWICFVFSMFFMKTKGFLTTIVLYFAIKFFLEKKNLRLPILVTSIALFSVIVLLSFKYELSSMGHLTNLLLAAQTFYEHPLFGLGLGSTSVLYEDSFVAKILVEGGLYLFGLFCFMVFYLMKNYKENNSDWKQQVAFVLATFIPLFLSGAAIHLVAIYLNLFYLGLMLRRSNISVKNENTIKKASYCY